MRATTPPTTELPAIPPPKNHLKSVLLPQQHGGWGFWLEPALAGLLIAPSLAGGLLTAAALLVFLLHQPLRVAVKDRRKGRIYQRTRLATRAAVAIGASAALLLIAALLTAEQGFWPALLIAAPFALFQLAHEFTNSGRDSAAEMAGAIAFTGLSAAIVLAGGHPLAEALALWAVLAAARGIASIAYVRARLRQAKQQPLTGLHTPAVIVVLHVLALALISGLAALGHIHWTGLLGGVLLLARVFHGFSERERIPARTIGLREIGFGILFALSLVL